MSEIVNCDHCGRKGVREEEHISPSDWLYLEACDEGHEDEVTYVYACSEDCSKELWKKGPGELEVEEVEHR